MLELDISPGHCIDTSQAYDAVVVFSLPCTVSFFPVATICNDDFISSSH